MIDMANLFLDECKQAEYALESSAIYKASLDAGHYYNKINKERNSTPTRLKEFMFPRPPQVQSIRPLSTSSVCNGTSDSDTQSDSDCRCRPRTRPKRSSPIAITTTSGSFSATQQENLSSSSPMTFPTLPTFLPPIGVFWDIENCRVPKGCSAVLVAQVIRDSFFEGYREAEFLVVCDVTKEPSKVIEELNDAQVNLIHVPSLHKNAADEKLRQSMRRFADIHGSPAAVVLITSDINFISDVSDLRHRRKIHVILLHRDNTSESLILCANENHNIVRLFESLPLREAKSVAEPYQLTVYNIPVTSDPPQVKSRLRRISDNCGGRVVEVVPSAGLATIVFTTRDLAQRAQKRMSGADVFGNKITVGAPTRADRRPNGATPTKNASSSSTSYVMEEQRTYVSAGAPQQHVTATHYSAVTSATVTQFGPTTKAGPWADKRQPGIKDFTIALKTPSNPPPVARSGGMFSNVINHTALTMCLNNALTFQKSFPPSLASSPGLVVNESRVQDFPIPSRTQTSPNVNLVNPRFNMRPLGTSNVPAKLPNPICPEIGPGDFVPLSIEYFNVGPDGTVTNVPLLNQYLNPLRDRPIPPYGNSNIPNVGSRFPHQQVNVPPPFLSVPPPNVVQPISCLRPAVNVPRLSSSALPPRFHGPPPSGSSVPPPALRYIPPPTVNPYVNAPIVRPYLFAPPNVNPYMNHPPAGNENVPLVTLSLHVCMRPDGSIKSYPDMFTYPAGIGHPVTVNPYFNKLQFGTGNVSCTNQYTHINQMSNGHDSGQTDYCWKQPVPAQSTKKNGKNGHGRDVTPDKFRPIRKQQQDNDMILMPPPVPASNRKTYNNQAQNNQVPVAGGYVPPRRVSPYVAGSAESGTWSGAWSLPPGSTSPYSLASDEEERFFHPIPLTPKPEPVDLQVTNLDQSIDTKEMKKILMTVFSEHVMVLHVSVYVQSDGNLGAHIRVSSLADAQFAISQLHRRKVGAKRILISYANNGGPNPQLVRSQIVSLLVDIPGHRLPLFKFCELFESRYGSSVGVSELYKLRDVCVITETKNGRAQDEKCPRMISLNPDHRNTPSPAFNSSQEHMELSYCPTHASLPGPDKGWAEQEMDSLPNVRISLQVFTFRIHALVQSHKGCLPLPSLPRCYEAQFHALEVDETGVPLEHLVSCVESIDIYQGVGCVKYLRWVNKAEGVADEPVKCVSPPLAAQQGLFSRELVDLLKTSPHCQLLFNRFIPAYHHHFGRQCRVADYGYTKLVDLLEALPHIVQVLGEGNKRIITLSHRAQVRRFTSDLLRVLKAQASKQVLLSEFAATFARVINREWDIVDYGVCDIADMLSEVSQSSVVITQLNNDIMISFPKREQTPTEVTRTKKFADEIDDSSEGERRLSLTLPESLKVLSSQIAMILRGSDNTTLLLADIPSAFKNLFGFALRPETYGCSSVMQLVQLLGDNFTVVDSGYGGPMARLRHPFSAAMQGMKVWRVLMEENAPLCMTASQFLGAYWRCHKEVCAFDRLAELPDIVQVSFAGGELIVQLTAVMSFAGDVYHLLLSSADGRVPLDGLESEYRQRYGRTLQPTQYGHATLDSLLAAIGEVATVGVGADGRKVVSVNDKLREVGVEVPPSKPAGAGPCAPDSPRAFLNGLVSSLPMFRMDPPKPDTPSKGLPITLPVFQQPKMAADLLSSKLLSPAAGLMAAHKNQAGSGVPLNIVSPAANQLPMPTAFAVANQLLLDEKDCDAMLANGEQTYNMLTNGNESLGDNSLEMNSSGNSTPTRVRRKKRLAAHFSTPIET